MSMKFKDITESSCISYDEMKIRVLLIEDNPGDAHLAKTALKRAAGGQFTVEWVEDIEAAFKAIENDQFDVIVSDLTLPDTIPTDPLASITEIVERGQGIPVIILSGNEDEELAFRALKAGAQDFMVKDQLQRWQLKRSIFYAIERNHLRENLERQAITLRNANEALSEAKKEADTANQAKSAFLANMSHELRTPLNSMLILSQMLSSDEEDPLSDSQKQSAEAIFSAGGDLMTLINEILDLSKVEAGKMTLVREVIQIDSVISDLVTQITPVIDNKGLKLVVDRAEGAPEVLLADELRLKQILKNLLSNAIKFTPEGKVTVRIQKPDTDIEINGNELRGSDSIAISVIDEGAGIAESRQAIIFDEFRQAEENTSRQFGGTGLGLSISKKLAILLGGDLRLESELGKGSKFTLLLPLNTGDVGVEENLTRESESVGSGEEQSAQVQGQKILIVDDDIITFKALSLLFKAKGIMVEGADSGSKALLMLKEQNYQCLIVDRGLPDMTGLEFLQQAKDERINSAPVILYTASDIESAERKNCGDLVQSFVIKGVNSPKKLIDEVFYHLKGSNASAKGFSAHATQEKPADLFWGKKILLVDDDSRNTFALTRVIQKRGIAVDVATDGEGALNKLNGETRYDLVLMDVMMPVMDGYETTRRIREDDRFADLPIIAVTAKAMLEDRDKCLAAGADDYLAKPIDIDILVEKLNTWFSKKKSALAQ